MFSSRLWRFWMTKQGEEEETTFLGVRLPASLENLSTFHAAQKIPQSFRRAHIFKFLRKKCRICKFLWQKLRIVNLCDKYLIKMFVESSLKVILKVRKTRKKLNSRQNSHCWWPFLSLRSWPFTQHRNCASTTSSTLYCTYMWTYPQLS